MLQKNVVHSCNENTIEQIRMQIKKKKMDFGNIDDTTDVDGRYVSNVIIDTLEIDYNGKKCLLNFEVSE